MNKLLLLFAVLLSLTGLSQKDKSGNVFTDVGDAAKMVVAKQKLYAEDHVGALNAFREVEKNNPNDASVKYYVALCYYNLKQYPKAMETLQKAVEIKKDIKPETYVLLGKLYQLEENFDKAIDAFNTYKSMTKADSESTEDTDVFLSQCKNAKNLMGSPLPVMVTSLGPDINSQYDDKNPCITADGRKLVFTTRRPESTADVVDAEGDGKYFENIYIAAFDSATREPLKPASIGSPVNTKAHDACTSISPDGKQIFLYKNDANDKASRGGNVFVSKITNGKWKTPESIGKPINSSYWEGGACVSSNGKSYFFSSERSGGYGGSDIWMVTRNKKEWGTPVNLGPQINTPYDEAGMFLAPDGKTLFFCSNGPLSMGGYDILKTVLENGRWSAPVNVGFPINSPGKEGQLTVSADARYAYISSDRKGGLGESDLYRIDLKDYAILEKDPLMKSNGLSILKGTIREGFEGYGLPDVEITLRTEAGEQFMSTSTNELGEYFFTLRGGKYKIQLAKKGFKTIEELVDLGVSEKETVVLEKGYLLKK
jgi:Tol biopolymer transport system component